MNEQEVPKKIAAEQVEVIGKSGEVVREATRSRTTGSRSTGPLNFGSGFGQVKVFKGGPWLLLLLPVMIPLFIFGFFLIAVFALFFGRGLFKVVGRNVRRN